MFFFVRSLPKKLLENPAARKALLEG